MKPDNDHATSAAISHQLRIARQRCGKIGCCSGCCFPTCDVASCRLWPLRFVLTLTVSGDSTALLLRRWSRRGALGAFCLRRLGGSTGDAAAAAGSLHTRRRAAHRSLQPCEYQHALGNRRCARGRPLLVSRKSKVVGSRGAAAAAITAVKHRASCPKGRAWMVTTFGIVQPVQPRRIACLAHARAQVCGETGLRDRFRPLPSASCPCAPRDTRALARVWR